MPASSSLNDSGGSEKFYDAYVTDISVKREKYIVIKLSVYGSFSYKPGNSIEMYLDRDLCGDDECYRVFSLASSPTEDFLMIVTIDSGSRFKRALMGLKGGRVRITGPWSMNFALREELDSVLLIGYSIGVSPMRSMVKYVYDQGRSDIDVKLIYVDEEGFYLFREELEDMARGRGNIEVVFMDKVPDPSTVSSMYRDLGKPYIYVSGLPQGVREIVKSIRDAGIKISRETMAIESFEGY